MPKLELKNKTTNKRTNKEKIFMHNRISVTNASVLKMSKFIIHDSFLRVMIHSLLCVIIHTSAKMMEQNAFLMTHILPILRLKAMEYFYMKLSDPIVYSYSKHAVMSASEYIGRRVYFDIRMFMQLTHENTTV